MKLNIVKNKDEAYLLLCALQEWILYFEDSELDEEDIGIVNKSIIKLTDLLFPEYDLKNMTPH